MKRIVEDAESLLAYDRVNGTPQLETDTYLLRAIESVTLHKQRCAEAEPGVRKNPGRMAHPALQLLAQMPFSGRISFISEEQS